MSFVVIGRPPGTITYQRMPACGIVKQTITARHPLRSRFRQSAGGATKLLEQWRSDGWAELEVFRLLGEAR